MELSTLATYYTAVLAWTVTPGPAMAVVFSRSVRGDLRGAGTFAAGLCLGWQLLAGAVALGLGGLAQSEAQWFAAAKFLGISYLLWLSVRMWHDDAAAGGAPAGRTPTGRASLAAGLAMPLSNPGTVLVYLLMVPTVASADVPLAAGLGLVLLLTLATGATAVISTILLARSCRRIAGSAASARRLNRACATAVGLTALWMLRD